MPGEPEPVRSPESCDLIVCPDTCRKQLHLVANDEMPPKCEADSSSVNFVINDLQSDVSD